MIYSILLTGLLASPAAAARPAKLRDAVVRIEISLHGVPVSHGTGFYVSEDGLLVTNDHVMRNAFEAGYTTRFQTLDGASTTAYEVADCGDERGLDLCLLKVKAKPKLWFGRAASPIEPGDKLFAIGHPRDFDFSVSDGVLSASRTNARGVRELQVSAPISPGNSGGPVFDEAGRLLGMATWIRVDQGSQNLNFAIAASEIWAYVDAHRKLSTLKDIHDRRRARLTALADSFEKPLWDPAYDAVEKGRPLGDDFTPVRVGPYEFSLPKEMAAECRRGGSEAEPTLACPHPADYGFVTFKVMRSAAGAVGKLHGQLATATPLEIVAYLQKTGRWAEYEKKLAPEQLKHLFLMPKPYKCKFRPESRSPLLSGADDCSATFYNDEQPNAASVNHVVQQRADGAVVIIKAWTSEAWLAGYTIHAAAIAKISGRFAAKPR